jgi:glycosyltransferase involved in cell wall biosynthesis
LVEHGENGLLIPPGRVEPLTEAITMLAKDAGLREQMGARGREKVCREFDVGLAAELYSQVFSRIRPGRPVPIPQVSDGATDAAAGV